MIDQIITYYGNLIVNEEFLEAFIANHCVCVEFSRQDRHLFKYAAPN